MTLKLQRWSQVVAWAAFASTIPSALWRVLMIQGALPGTAELRASYAGQHGYVWGLSIVQLLAGFATVGLAQPWGERIGRFTIPPWLPIVLGAIGGLIVTYLFTISLTVSLAMGQRPDAGLLQGGALLVMVLAYLPIFFWGPLVLAAVVGYAKRRLAPRAAAAHSSAESR